MFGTCAVSADEFWLHLLKKVLSTGECGVKPRGFGMGFPSLASVFVPSTYVFTKALALTVPQSISFPST